MASAVIALLEAGVTEGPELMAAIEAMMMAGESIADLEPIFQNPSFIERHAEALSQLPIIGSALGLLFADMGYYSRRQFKPTTRFRVNKYEEYSGLRRKGYSHEGALIKMDLADSHLTEGFKSLYSSEARSSLPASNLGSVIPEHKVIDEMKGDEKEHVSKGVKGQYDHVPQRSFLYIKPAVRAIMKKTMDHGPWTPWQEADELRTIQPTSSTNECGYNSEVILTRSNLTSLMANFRAYVDVIDTNTAPTTFEPFDFTKYPNTVLQLKGWCKAQFRNNYTQDCNILIYWLTNRSDVGTGATPYKCIQEGIKDRAEGVVDYSLEPYSHPEDSALFLEQYYVKQKMYFRLSPGEESSVFLRLSHVSYSDDANQAGVETTEWLNGVTHHLLIRQVGTISHDNVDAVGVGYGATKLDVVLHNHFSYRACGINPFHARAWKMTDNLDDTNLQQRHKEDTVVENDPPV